MFNFSDCKQEKCYDLLYQMKYCNWIWMINKKINFISESKEQILWFLWLNEIDIMYSSLVGITTIVLCNVCWMVFSWKTFLTKV